MRVSSPVVTIGIFAWLGVSSVAAIGGPCAGGSACRHGNAVSVVIRASSQPVSPKKPGLAPRGDGPQRLATSTPKMSGRPLPTGSREVRGDGNPNNAETMALPLNLPCPTGDGEIMKTSCNNPAPGGMESGVNFGAAPAQVANAAAPAAPTYTPEQAAQEAWTTQVFTKPNVSIQPVGNTTLTGLPTYFHATFAPAGLAPGESVTTTVLGHTVTIRPASAMYTYHYGDGTSFGPTKDPGGTYPQGKVTHTYTKKAVVSTRIDVTLTGEYQIGGGAWQAIPGATTVTGTPEQLTVAVLQSRLHN